MEARRTMSTHRIRVPLVHMRIVCWRVQRSVHHCGPVLVRHGERGGGGGCPWSAWDLCAAVHSQEHVAGFTLAWKLKPCQSAY
eukprot:13931135-Alexandrium_andersonii.AAC.1